MTQIAQFARRAVQTAPNKIATVCEGRERTYREFYDRVERLAGGLHAAGFMPGERIAILSLNSDRYLESLFGLSHGGFVIVPINTRLAPPEIVFWLADSGCAALFVDDAYLPVLPSVLPRRRTCAGLSISARAPRRPIRWITKRCLRARRRCSRRSARTATSPRFSIPAGQRAGPRA